MGQHSEGTGGKCQVCADPCQSAGPAIAVRGGGARGYVAVQLRALQALEYGSTRRNFESFSRMRC